MDDLRKQYTNQVICWTLVEELYELYHLFRVYLKNFSKPDNISKAETSAQYKLPGIFYT